MRKPPCERSTSSRCLPSWLPLTWRRYTQIQMYWPWKWLESYNNCTFSTWKDKCLCNLLFWIPNSFCTFHDYGRGGTPFLASSDGPSLIFYYSDFWTNQSCPETFHCVEIFFIFQDFWATCACPEKQSVPWIHCTEYIFFIIQNFEQPGLALKNRICPENFHCIEIFFIFQNFWAAWACPENRVCPEFSSRGAARLPRPAPRTPLSVSVALNQYRRFLLLHSSKTTCVNMAVIYISRLEAQTLAKKRFSLKVFTAP